MFIKTDSRRKILIPGDEQETISFAAKHFIECAKEAIAKHNAFFVALSGGSTPKKIFEALLNQHKDSIDWQKVFLFWSDERAVPKDHPESNYRMAMDAAFSKLPLLSSHIFRMQAEEHIEKNALLYETTIQSVLGNNSFDLIMLGVGEDGHIASLFPNTKALTEVNHLVVANHVPQKNCDRMTFTYPLINSAHHTVIYALGASKEAVLKEIFILNRHPASLLGTTRSLSLWILDESAGKFLLNFNVP